MRSEYEVAHYWLSHENEKFFLAYGRLFCQMLPLATSGFCKRLDVPKASDHLPVIVDFDLSGKTYLIEDTPAHLPLYSNKTMVKVIFGVPDELGQSTSTLHQAALIYKVEKSTIGDFYLGH